MKTLEQVREYFKDVHKVKCANSSYKGFIELDKIEDGDDGWFIQNPNKDNWVVLYNADTREYAKILSYKSTKEKTPKKELKALLNLAKECLEKPNSEVCQQWKDKILDACPSLKVESDVLAVGQWYEGCTDRGFHYFCFSGTYDFRNNPNGYGFGNDGQFLNIDESDGWGTSNIKKADPKKVKELLIAECVKNGLNRKSQIEPISDERNSNYNNETIMGGSFEFIDNKLYCLGFGRWCVFKDGKFAKPIETISLSEAERRLNLKIKID